MRPDSQIDSVISEEARQRSSAVANETEIQVVRAAGKDLAANLSWLPGKPESQTFAERCQALLASLKTLSADVEEAFSKARNSEDLLWLRNNVQQLSAGARVVTNELGPLSNMAIVANKQEIQPRVLAIAQGYLDCCDGAVFKADFTAFCLAFEEIMPLEFHEIGALVPALKLVLLERIAARGKVLVKDPASKPSERVVPYIRALQHVTQTSWKSELESLIPFDGILRDDPVGAYAGMDIESRNVYRESVARIAERSDRSEMEVANEALALARKAQKRKYENPRIAVRESHVGYYLIAEGVELLCQRVGYNPTFGERVRKSLRKYPDDFLLLGIAALTFAIVTGALWLLTPPTTPIVFLLVSMLVLILPSSQAAVQIMNYLTTNLLPATSLPKLDFSTGVPDDCVTLVAIPTLLLNENQVRHLVEELEVRYLGNHDRNIHFALVSDLPDSDVPAPEEDALVALCSKLILELNERYGAKNEGSFFLLHRHRVYNPRERGWMGWERKRGKLLDLNQFLRGHFDSFPVKIGELPILSKVRFVITLDSDTELPRGSAQRMVGALAHPLNQAIIDPSRNIVVAGYGILQPRVGISVQCTARSRLAAIFAGETGLDPYTRAISDVYQDLYGEGTFTGKGIYEVDTMFKVLYGRFPRNALLSHDLIEGAYARVGLATDIIVIEDYPTHYSAYSRRKHRWLRGDWQIVEWLTDRVPEESGARVPNPISLISRWKIFDNLRRSLVEPATFALLLFGWLATNEPVVWTLGVICILFVPAWVELAFGLTRAIATRQARVARDAFNTLFATNFTTLLTLTLLAHQTLLSVDAVVRALVRQLVTRERQLEWETAAEAELGQRYSTIDRYLDWMPVISVGLGVLLWFAQPYSLWAAVPILLLWASSKQVAVWLNSCPFEPHPETPRNDARLLRKSTLHIWRYFAELSNEEHHWLIPDNVEDRGKATPIKVASSVSPTNVGLLLNARQVASELGYLTVPELADLTQKTLATVGRLAKYRGHLMNWYDTQTLEPKAPFFISSVDSGNLVASLWTLRQGALDRLHRPILSRALANGLIDYLRVLVAMRAFERRTLSRLETELSREDWLTTLTNFPEEHWNGRPGSLTGGPGDASWFRENAHLRVQKVREVVAAYLPWKLPEFAALRQKLMEGVKDTSATLPLLKLPDLIAELEARLDAMIQTAQNGNRAATQRLKVMLAEAHQNASNLIDVLRQTNLQARNLADEMDFSFLLDKQRMLLSVGFDAQSEELQPYCYDLLATEPRTAVFVAIAKEDIPQDCWFRLERPFTNVNGRPVLLSWTGTMFEYLMPSIWMRSYPNTLLHRAGVAAVQTQQEYAHEKGILWGISESACAKRNEAGDYHYEAFGVPTLALQKNESEPLVVSPYSSFLALNVDRTGALANLQRMDSLGWFGSYGFYEAADYTNSRRRLFGPRYELVRQWMVHHQGMSFLSLANFFCDNVVQRWFHSERRVQATELLLQEKPVSHALAA